MQAGEVKIGEWISRGFDLYKANMGLLIVAGLLTVLIGFCTGGILAGPMWAGMIMIVLRLLDKTEPKPEVGDVFKGFSVFLNAFLFGIVWGAIVAVGFFILMLIPCIGVVLGTAYALGVGTLVMFGLFLIADRNMAFWPASMESIQTVKASILPFFGLLVVAAVIGGIGSIACGIGAVVTEPIMVCILAVAYREVFGTGAPKTPAS